MFDKSEQWHGSSQADMNANISLLVKNTCHHLWYRWQTWFSRISAAAASSCKWRKISLYGFITVFVFISQVKNPTNAKCAAKRSARAPTWSPTAGSTRASNRLDVTFAPRASSARWISEGTTRASTAWSEHSSLKCFYVYSKYLSIKQNKLILM